MSWPRNTPRILIHSYGSVCPLKEHLQWLQTNYNGVFTDLGIVDETGRQVAYEGPFQLANADYSQAPWFQAAKSRPYYISDVIIGLRGHPHFTVAVKIQSALHH